MPTWRTASRRSCGAREHSHPLDLSDEGLLADLEDHIEDGAQLLGVDAVQKS
jgi:hypothetical protein